jgi:cytochrome c-type biogenesis protein
MGSVGFIGLILLSQRAQDAFTRLATPLAGWANEQQNSLDRFGLAGQAGIGVLLGLVWSPCIGPTLGAATVLAAEGKDLGEVAFVMFAFALGIATVLLILATATRSFLGRWRGRLMQAGSKGKLILGGLLVLVGIMILTGLDHLIEGILIELSPEWLTELTTTF